jgi:hypothetical protein
MANCCTLITNTDFCTYVKGMDLDKSGSAVQLANLDMLDLFGQDCYDLLCAGTNADLETIKADCRFQIYLSRLIEYYWLIDNGAGSNKEAGFTRKQGDEFSEFTIVDSKELVIVLRRKELILVNLKEKVQSYIETFELNCMDSCTDSINCGCNATCTTDCTCGNTYSNYSNDMGVI